MVIGSQKRHRYLEPSRYIIKVYKNKKGIKVRSAVYLHPGKIEVSIGEGTGVLVDEVLLICKIGFTTTFV